MLSLMRTQTAVPPAVDRHPAPENGQFAGAAPPAGVSLGQHVQAFDGTIQSGGTRRNHARRTARRTRLHGYALPAVALSAFVVVLATANTTDVKISWLFGTSRVSLLWLILAAAIIGWLLGLLTDAALHRGTHEPRPASRP